MFETIGMAPPDAILGLTEAFKKDPNPNKINLGVGVYKDAKGDTPILATVRAAEAKLAALHGHLREFGRDPATFGLEGWLRMHEPDEDQWAASVAGWRKLGAQMVMLYPMYRMPEFDAQIETLRRFKDVARG